MTEYHQLDENEKQAANAVISHWSQNPNRGKYPPTKDGIKNYIDDQGGAIVVKWGAGAIALSGAVLHKKYSSKLLDYLEKTSKKAFRV